MRTGYRIVFLLPLLVFSLHSLLRAQLSDPDDIYWDGRFGSLGVEGPVFASESSGDLLFLAGRFNSTAQLPTSNIVAWSRTTYAWDSLTSGLDGEVYALHVSGDYLYVGGNFHHAGGIPSPFLARWHIPSHTWSTVPGGTPDTTVWEITEHNGELYISGEFHRTGGVKTVNLAVYSPATTTWRGEFDTVYAANFGREATVITTIAFDGEDMYVGGQFEYLDALPGGRPFSQWVHAGCIALKRNGVWRNLIRASWPHSPISYGVSGKVWKILPTPNYILLGGEFRTADQDGTEPCFIEHGNSIINCHGFTGWSKQRETFTEEVAGCGAAQLRLPSYVYDIINYQGRIFLTGSISQAGTTPNTAGFIEWNPGNFSPINAGPLGGLATGYTLHIFGEELLIAGEFSRAGKVYTKNATLWNAAAYRPLSSVPDNGANGPIYASLAGSSGLYIGGNFSVAGGKRTYSVARWDGSSWNALDTSIHGTVYALAQRGSELYAGGYFSLGSSTTRVNVARWDGTRWTALAAGLDDTVHALTVLGNDLIAGGAFTHSGSTTLNRIARWNGSSWSDFSPGGADGTVFTFSTDGTTLHAGGRFTRIGGTAALRVAEWNGSAWSALGSGVGQGVVYALAETPTTLYIGGDFLTVGGNVPASFVAQWDRQTSSWHPLSDNTRGICNTVHALAAKGNDLYVGGKFNKINDVSFNFVARWDGTRWNPLGTAGGNGVDDTVRTLAMYDTSLYVGGEFISTADGYANRIAEWSGKRWSQLGEVQSAGLNGPVNALALSPEFVYAGGSFQLAGTTVTPNIARFSRVNGSWVPMVTGTNGPVHAMVFHRGKLYIGGQFDEAGGVSINNLAMWDPDLEQWKPVGSSSNGTDGPVYALVADGDRLYIGGNFSNGPGGIAAHNLVAWNIATGTAEPVGGVDSTVRSLAIADQQRHLFVGGDFQNVNSDVSPLRANFIARFNLNDGIWERLGAGMSDPVLSLHALQEDVYVGGPFLVAGTIQPQRVARWDDKVEFWDYLDGGVPGTIRTTVSSVHARGREVFVGGNFQRAGAVPASLIARWDTLERQWKSLGSGVELEGGGGTVSAMASDGQDLWVGGNFTAAGQKGSLFIGRWTKPSPNRAQHTGVDDGVTGAQIGTIIGHPSPNPFDQRISLPLHLAESESVELVVLDAAGRVVDEIATGERLERGAHTLTWSPEARISDGLYFLRLRVGIETRTFPITLVR